MTTAGQLTCNSLQDGDSLWSFRDPGGRLLSINGRILRLVHPTFSEEFKAVLSSPAVQQLIRNGKVVRTDVDIRDLPYEVQQQLLANPGASVVEHDPISFPSFPHEWAPEMLYAAAELTLDIAEAVAPEDLGLKDGTAFNVLFRGPQPVFVDVLSFERRQPNDPVWLPYAQFIRTFLLPLLVNRYFRTPLSHLFVANREGLEPEEVYHALKWSDRLRPPFLKLVCLPVWLAARKDADDDSIYRSRRLANPEQARYVVRGTLRRLRKTLRTLRPLTRNSTWSNYTRMTHYSNEQTAAKLEFVQSSIQRAGKNILDIGCNSGTYSVACARKGAKVVALDSDPVVVGLLWRVASEEKLDILPLSINLAQPTPATGWRNQECRSFLERARGNFDIVLMLAVIHHLLVSERVPLFEIIRLLAELTTDAAVVEFIPNTDPMFRRLLRGRDSLHLDYTQQSFEQACTRFFRIERKQELEHQSRCLYLLRK